MPKFQAIKTYGNDRGLSCCFRQWKATHSHCSTLHGYSVGIELTFESEILDDKNWSMDYGNLKPFKDWADHMFDHTLIIAEDDPELEFFKAMYQRSQIQLAEGEKPEDFIPYKRGAICDLRIVPGVGCEMFSKLAYEKMEELLKEMKEGKHSRYPVNKDVQLVSVKVFEHGSNASLYKA